jgi:iron complex outermembrane recepter protein
MLKVAFAIVMFIFLTTNRQLHSQSKEASLTGRIASASTQQPLVGVNIFLKNNNAGTVSDDGGKFVFNNLIPGDYVLIFSHIGYQIKEKKLRLTTDQKHHLEVFLKDSVLLTEAVEITASKINILSGKTHRLHTINAKEIASVPVQSINQVLDYAVGVLSENTTGIFSSRVIVTMRGMPANDQGRTLVIKDGMPLNKSDGGSVNWHLLNKNDVEQINIIKGPGPARYGSGAMGGVIEIETKMPTDKLAGEINLEYGTFNTFGGNIRLSGLNGQKNEKNNWSWKLHLNGRQSNGYITVPDVYHTIEDTILVPSYLDEYSVALNIGFEPLTNQRVEVHGQFFDDRRGNGVKVFDEFGAYSKHTTYSLKGRYYGTGSSFRWDMHIYRNSENYFRIYEYMNEGEYKLYEADAIRGDMGMKTDLDFFGSNRHKPGAGINFTSGSINGSDTYFTSTDIIHNSGKMDVFAIYFQDEISFSDEKFHVNAGLRYDFARFYDANFSIEHPSYSIDFYKDYETSGLAAKHWDALSPRFSTRYNHKNKIMVFASYARGFRAPRLDDMTRTGARRGTFAVANPNLKPEIVDAFELGADWQLNEKMFLSASLFHSIGKNFMYYTSTGDTVNMGYRLAPIITKSNIGKVEISGMEAELKYEPARNFTAFVNYTFTNAKIIAHNIVNPGVDSLLTGKYLTDIPKHKIASGVNWQNKIVNTSLLFRYYGKTWINEWNVIEQEYFFSDRLADWVTFNIRLEKQLYQYFNVALEIENILDKKFVDSNLQQNPGRMIFLKIGMELK